MSIVIFFSFLHSLYASMCISHQVLDNLPEVKKDIEFRLVLLEAHETLSEPLLKVGIYRIILLNID